MIGRWGKGARLLVAATAAWTTFLILHVLLAGNWWPWVIVEMTPPLTTVAVPMLLLAFVPFARPVRRRLSILLVLLLLAGAYLAGYGRGWTGSATASPRDTAIKVFAWNTNYWEMENDPDSFYAFLRRQNADVYLLQEHLYGVINNTSYNQVIRIDATASLRATFPGYQISVEGEFITLSRLPIVAAHHQTVPSAGDDWFWKGPKFQRTEIRVGRRTVSFYNVHLPGPFRGGNPFTGGFYQRQKKQSIWRFENLRKLHTDVAGNPHPIVLAGDFNSPWTELYSFPPGTQAHGPPGALAPLHTWPISRFSLPRMWRLDWLYTTGDLAIPSYHLDGGGKALSDHAAQEFRVIVPDEAHEQKGP
ncbi:endonuclease/exonuclease/phosphatase family protein [Nonomuraea sp. B19D2]|uniref:endonuclease/exonuclease/phosphatase family protein n=1 Tax=Nonomuraea sp. B19D2 TaxID=3159561 RepID=UPI0032DAE549